MKTVVKAVTILKLFSDQSPTLGVVEIAEATGIDKAIVHRILRTLVDEELVVQNPATRKYALGPGVLRLASNHISQSHALEVARPHLMELWEQTDETIHLCILQGTSLFLNFVLESRQAVRVSSRLGEKTPLHCTAGGKVFLAYNGDELVRQVVAEGLTKYTPKTIIDEAALLKETAKIQRQGYALGVEEYGLGFCSVAAPLFDDDGGCSAAVVVAMPLPRGSKKRLIEIAGLLSETCAQIAPASS